MLAHGLEVHPAMLQPGIGLGTVRDTDALFAEGVIVRGFQSEAMHQQSALVKDAQVVQISYWARARRIPTNATLPVRLHHRPRAVFDKLCFRLRFSSMHANGVVLFLRKANDFLKQRRAHGEQRVWRDAKGDTPAAAGNVLGAIEPARLKACVFGPASQSGFKDSHLPFQRLYGLLGFFGFW